MYPGGGWVGGGGTVAGANVYPGGGWVGGGGAPYDDGMYPVMCCGGIVRLDSQRMRVKVKSSQAGFLQAGCLLFMNGLDS